MTPDVPAGVYRHYKAERYYLVLGLGHDANDGDRTVVIYVPLYVDAAEPGPRLAVRTVEDFVAWVDPLSRATVEVGTPGAVRRFTYVADSPS
ncbi:MAG: hypothetical protein JWP11_2199 [Frankiales bacterium]|jgi:hypothetical protein|nr:hypothetical protein [Frankiales bacterium]